MSHTNLKAILLGMSSRKLFVRLSDEGSVIQWKTEPGSWNAEHGEVDLTAIKAVKPCGVSGLQFISKEKVALEIIADDSGIRDQWMVAVTEILEKWSGDPKSKPESQISAAGTSNKAEYFKLKEKELAERAKQREDKKKKYAQGGLTHTAQIMASR